VNEEVRVGKDILELVAGAMYTNPLSVFREYVQNAADSIELRRRSGADRAGEVHICFDHQERSVLIRDNGISIPKEEFVSRLITFGASKKRGQGLRGFRGVGRLSGLGFCQELVFRGREAGEKRITEVTWDGRVLKQFLKDPNFEGNLQDIVREAVTVKTFAAADQPDSFFEVEMKKLLRLQSDVLLNEEAVEHYLAHVAPVPISRTFPLWQELQVLSEKYGNTQPIELRVGSNEEPIERYGAVKRPNYQFAPPALSGLETFELTGIDGEVTAYGWVADHAYAGALPKMSGWGGLRLRAGDIQVGDLDLAARLFPEERFNAWTIGEIHVISNRILPNARRDDFEPSVHYAHLQDEVSHKAKEISSRIRQNSILRNRVRTVEADLKRVDEWVSAASAAKVPRLVLTAIQNISRSLLIRASDQAKHISNTKDARTLGRKIDDLGLQLSGLNGRGSRKTTQKTVVLGLEEPMIAAVAAILQSSKSPKDGVALAAAVLDAFEGKLS
jgi:molecular chaperone HtpG